MQECVCCGCPHFEDSGHGVCMWQPTTAAGEATLKEFRRWDVQYCADKHPRIQRAMQYMMQEAPEGHLAKMNAVEREAFFAKVLALNH